MRAAVIGHRGAAGRAPENTIAGLRVAARLGVGCVEFDVRLSRDGCPVLIHDDTVDRTTGGRGRVADLDLTLLRTLDAGAWFGSGFRGEPIPTLREAIGTLADLDLGANIELKPDSRESSALAATVVKEIRSAWPALRPPPLLSSFDPELLAAVAALAPELPRAICVRTIPADWRQRLVAVGAAALHCSIRGLDRRRLADVIGAGVPVRCYTVNSRRTASRLFAANVAAVFSDVPDKVLPSLTSSDIVRAADTDRRRFR